MSTTNLKEEEMEEDELPALNSSIQNLRTGLAPFAFSSPNGTPDRVLRRSSRSPIKTEKLRENSDYLSCTPLRKGLKRALEEEGAPVEVDLPATPNSEAGTSGSVRKSPRKGARASGSTPSPLKKARSTQSPAKAPKRPYAPPEKYKHLSYLDDHLKEELDSAFSQCRLVEHLIPNKGL
jgi:hypothetical protein